MYKKLERLMNAKGVTPYKVCKDLDINPATFTHWKNGRSKPSLDCLLKVARYFGVTADYLMEE